MLLAAFLLGFTAQDDVQIIRDWLSANFSLSVGQYVDPVRIDGMTRFTQGDRFYALHFREWPIARAAPAPLTARNLLVLDGKEIRAVPTRDSWEKLAPRIVRPLTVNRQIRDLLVAYIELSKEYSQDGFFHFQIPPERLNVSAVDGGLVATGYATVDPSNGDRGELASRLTFERSHKGYVLASISEKDTTQPGVRPICQATKLLDPDPIVRRMAERDLLVMGRRAEGYLKEQRAKASPELKSAIDRIWSRIVRGERR